MSEPLPGRRARPFLLALAALAPTVPADAQTPEPEMAPLELVQVLSRGGSAPEVLVGRLPEATARVLPLPEHSRVVGSLVHGPFSVSAIAVPGSPATAQDGACGFDRCGLRLQHHAVFRGPGDDRVASARGFYPDLRFLLAADDSVALLAAEALDLAERSILARQVAVLGLAPALVLYQPFDQNGDVRESTLWVSGAAGIIGYVAAMLGTRWDTRLDPALSRAVWHYNRAVAAGEVTGAPPALPHLEPAHHGRTGLMWGLATGTVVGSFLAGRNRTGDDDLTFDALVLPWGGAAAGWLVGRLVPRRR